MKQLFLFTILAVSISCVFSQNPDCKVLPDSLKGTYEGECIKGKAEGKGKAVGSDTYEGEFKNGLPDGTGTYTWKDGHYFVGLFKKGIKSGKGEMHYPGLNSIDSVVTGYWKKDKYFGKYEEEYMVVSKTSHISKVEFNLLSAKGADINITVFRRGGTSSGGDVVPYITNISVSQGTYYTKNDQVLSNTSITKIREVTFPFKAIFYLSNSENVELLFNSKGDYEVNVDIF